LNKHQKEGKLLTAKDKRKREQRTGLRWQARRSGARQRLGTFGLLGAAIVLVVAVLAGLVLLDQRRSSPAQTQEPDVSLDKSEGAAAAPVVVVEYADFQCPYCRQFAFGPEQRIRTEYISQGQVRFAFRHMAFIGPESLWAAAASECANEQGRFWDYHNLLFERQGGENVGDFSQDRLKGFAVDLGLDRNQFNQCLDSGKYQDKVQQETTQGQQLGVRGTPTVFVNGQLIENGSRYETLKAAIEAALRP
jgi:protein-disulfide isomerase